MAKILNILRSADIFGTPRRARKIVKLETWLDRGTSLV
jgi:hypothetical protein